MGLAPFNMVTLSFATSKTTYLVTRTSKYQKTRKIMASTGWSCHIPLKCHGVTGENGKLKKLIEKNLRKIVP
jgi:hypothetical protein